MPPEKLKPVSSGYASVMGWPVTKYTRSVGTTKIATLGQPMGKRRPVSNRSFFA